MRESRGKVDSRVQDRLGEIAAELQHIIYGAQEYPGWGTKFIQIENDGMSVGLEPARLLMEQSVG